MASGKPDYKDDSIISGKFGAVFVPVGVDVDGNMLAVMQGDFGGVLSTIAVDAAGRMIANLGAQDIDRIMVTPSSGPVNELDISHNFLGVGDFVVANLLGKGTITGGYLIHNTAVDHTICGPIITIDGVGYDITDFVSLQICNIIAETGSPIRLIKYDNTNFYYVIGFNFGITFETSFHIRLNEMLGASWFVGQLFYTLIP